MRDTHFLVNKLDVFFLMSRSVRFHNQIMMRSENCWTVRKMQLEQWLDLSSVSAEILPAVSTTKLACMCSCQLCSGICNFSNDLHLHIWDFLILEKIYDKSLRLLEKRWKKLVNNVCIDCWWQKNYSLFQCCTTMFSVRCCLFSSWRFVQRLCLANFPHLFLSFSSLFFFFLPFFFLAAVATFWFSALFSLGMLLTSRASQECLFLHLDIRHA